MFLFTDRVAKEPAPSPQQAATPHAAKLMQASSATGVSFDYLAKTAERESNFNPSAKASTSSATGMFQFLEQTWLGMVKQEGPKSASSTRLRRSRQRRSLQRQRSGHAPAHPVAPRGSRHLRDDGRRLRFAQRPAAGGGSGPQAARGRALHRPFPRGFRRARPDQSCPAESRTTAAAHFDDAAAANRSVFFDRSGRARSAAEVYANLTSSFRKERLSPSSRCRKRPRPRTRPSPCFA